MLLVCCHNLCRVILPVCKQNLYYYWWHSGWLFKSICDMSSSRVEEVGRRGRWGSREGWRLPPRNVGGRWSPFCFWFGKIAFQFFLVASKNIQSLSKNYFIRIMLEVHWVNKEVLLFYGKNFPLKHCHNSKLHIQWTLLRLHRGLLVPSNYAKNI